MSFQEVILNALIEPAPLKRAGRRNLPILSMTMHGGLIDQSSKFKKRVASADTTDYKLVPRNQLVVGFPIDEGVLSFQDLYDEALVSPAYDTWKLRGEFQVEPAYLERFLRSPRTLAFYRAKLRGTTARRRTLPDDIFLRLAVPLPPVAEQRRIAGLLDKADALRAKRSAALGHLDILIQSIFLDMFGDLAANSKGFPIVQMGDVCDVRDGTHDSPKYVSGGGYPLLTSKNVTGGVVDLTDVNYISEADYAQINKRSKVDRGDIILPMIGTIGSPVIVDEEPYYAIKNVALIKFTETSPSAVFVRHLLSGHYFEYIVSRKNRGGTQKFVSLGDLRAFPVPLPSNDEQREFVRRIEAVERIRSTNRRSKAEFDALFASVQHRAFQGEL